MAPLTRSKPACYYGCLLTRPPAIVRFDDPEDPQSMEAILRVCGAEPVAVEFPNRVLRGRADAWPTRTRCWSCRTMILCDARDHGANCLVVACPMCHVNLDMKQADIKRHDTTRA